MPSEVKGSWFVSLRARLDIDPNVQLLERVLRRIPHEYVDAVADPIASSWYPEAALSSALHAVDDERFKGDRVGFTEFMDSCTEIGVNRFFRAILRMTSPRFVLRQVPTMWKQIRRGDGRVEVVETRDGIELRYSEFPYFEDPLYEALTVGSLRALLRVCTGSDSGIEVARRRRNELWIRIAVT